LASKQNKGIFAAKFVMLRRLSELRKGQGGTIERLSDHEVVVKLMEMGCVPGAEIYVEAIAPLGDPVAVRVAGYCLSMRKKEAGNIWVQCYSEHIS
jgi:ferrous iron transport protein A